MNELRNRGVADILIAVVDGLKGFPEAINAVFPEAIVQTCIVHLIRNSMSFASRKERKFIARRCAASTVPRRPRPAWLRWRRSRQAPGPETPGHRHKLAATLGPVIPFFAFPEGVRRIISLTHYERHRGPEFEGSPCRPYPRPFPR
jgi:putative transposase